MVIYVEYQIILRVFTYIWSYGSILHFEQIFSQAWFVNYALLFWKRLVFWSYADLLNVETSHNIIKKILIICSHNLIIFLNLLNSRAQIQAFQIYIFTWKFECYHQQLILYIYIPWDCQTLFIVKKLSTKCLSLNSHRFLLSSSFN